MTRQKISSLLLCLLLVGTVCLVPACARPPAENNTAQTAPPQSNPAEKVASPTSQGSPLGLSITNQPAAKASPAPAPKISEVREAVKRVFESVTTPDATPGPIYVVGDFNGDGSEDLAVIVKPNEGKLSEVNNEVANWILEDPRKVFIPRANATAPLPSQPAPVRAEKGDMLLAIIHGVGPQGWRSTEAKQTFLLKNGGASNMTAESLKSLRASKDKQKLPTIRGDAIHSAIDGKSGLILWTGAKYAWYSPDLK